MQRAGDIVTHSVVHKAEALCKWAHSSERALCSPDTAGTSILPVHAPFLLHVKRKATGKGKEAHRGTRLGRSCTVPCCVWAPAVAISATAPVATVCSTHVAYVRMLATHCRKQSSAGPGAAVCHVTGLLFAGEAGVCMF